jgi:uncharacterized RDD family membrane protein YckC
MDAALTAVWAIAIAIVTAVWMEWALGLTEAGGQIPPASFALVFLGLPVVSGALAGPAIHRKGDWADVLVFAAIGAASLAAGAYAVATGDPRACAPDCAGTDLSFGFGAAIVACVVFVPFLAGSALGRFVALLLPRSVGDPVRPEPSGASDDSPAIAPPPPAAVRAAAVGPWYAAPRTTYTYSTFGARFEPDVPPPGPGLEWAGLAPRLMAFAIDGLVIGVLYGAVYLIDLAMAQSSDQGWDYPPAVVFALAGLLGLFFLVPLCWHFGGGTVGQRALGMRVVSELDGGRLSLRRAMIRYAMLLVMIFFVPLGVAGALAATLDPRRRAWTDIASHSAVVRRVGPA